MLLMTIRLSINQLPARLEGQKYQTFIPIGWQINTSKKKGTNVLTSLSTDELV